MPELTPVENLVFEANKALYKALAKATKDIPAYVLQEGKVSSTSVNYKYLSEEQIVQHVKDAFGKNGLAIIPVDDDIVVQEWRTKTTKYGEKVDHFVIIKSTYAIVHEGGGRITIGSSGSGMDSGDKAIPKAKTGAFKYALRQATLIASGDDPDKVRPEEDGDATTETPKAVGAKPATTSAPATKPAVQPKTTAPAPSTATKPATTPAPKAVPATPAKVATPAKPATGGLPQEFIDLDALFETCGVTDKAQKKEVFKHLGLKSINDIDAMSNLLNNATIVEQAIAELYGDATATEITEEELPF